MDLVLVIHRAEEGGYWAEVPPALEGCFAQAETLDDLFQEAQSAIASHLEALREDGRPFPQESVIVATVQMPEVA